MEPQIIQTKIFNIRGQMVMLDFDLAALYETETKYLKRSVKRNITRFPSDFMFELEKEELENLRCNFGTSSWGGTRYPPFAFTEQGVAMLSSVLKSEKAIQVNVAIIRAFVALRRYALTFDELAAKIISHDKELADINEVLRWLGEENQARANDISALQRKDEPSADWSNRPSIGFKK
ncbi:MAG: ORF6N domain-containing protein [Saprospiraceae bacterium]|nr:ORF6N domain-containing protein [Saprospiraceae bacterium]